MKRNNKTRIQRVDNSIAKSLTKWRSITLNYAFTRHIRQSSHHAYDDLTHCELWHLHHQATGHFVAASNAAYRIWMFHTATAAVQTRAYWFYGECVDAATPNVVDHWQTVKSICEYWIFIDRRERDREMGEKPNDVILLLLNTADTIIWLE